MVEIVEKFAVVWHIYVKSSFCLFLSQQKTVNLYPFQIHSISLSSFGSLIGPFGGFFASGFKRAFKIKVSLNFAYRSMLRLTFCPDCIKMMCSSISPKPVFHSNRQHWISSQYKSNPKCYLGFCSWDYSLRKNIPTEMFLQDFADTIPGHGGIMDRFDCQYLMATFVHVYIASFIR